MKNWAIKNFKYIVLVFILVIELAVTILGSSKDWWGEEINTALVFAAIMFAYISFFSYLNKDNNEHKEMRNESKKEHDEIKGIISLYKDLQLENSIFNFEGRYAEEHDGKNVEIWVISNSVDESAEIIKEIFKNLVLGVKYYYIIPKNDKGRCEKDLKKAFDKIKELNKKNHRVFEIKYIKDDLFDLMPTDFVDILFYCNPNETDYFAKGYKDNMRVFFSLQCSKDDIYYKPVDLDSPTKHQFFDKMDDWKNNKAWQTLAC